MPRVTSTSIRSCVIIAVPPKLSREQCKRRRPLLGRVYTAEYYESWWADRLGGGLDVAPLYDVESASTSTVAQAS